MFVSVIVAVADNGVIGVTDTQLPWQQSGDLRRFKSVTMGHPIIMGRKTHETINKPLPGRTNIIITRNPDYTAEGCVVVHSLQEALDVANAEGTDEAFVIGGGIIFKEALPVADKLYITEVHGEPNGDTFFKYDKNEWKEISRDSFPADEKNQFAYSFAVFTR